MKYCDKCGKEIKKEAKFCEGCGKSIISTNNNNKSNNKNVLNILLWIFFLPIMLCIFVWKNEKINKKYKLPIIIGIILITIIFGAISSASEEQLIKDTISRCYCDETYNKLDELYGIANLDGNFESDIECTNLKLTDSNYNEIVIIEKEEKLLSIQIKDGREYKYIYNVDKSYDLYDHNTLELKEPADEKLKAEREQKEQQEKEAEEKAKKLKVFTDIGLTEEAAEDAFEILGKCGIKTVSKLEKDVEVEGVTFYKTSGSGYELTISIYNGKLHFVSSGTLILFDRDANLYRNINNYTLTTEDKSNMKQLAEVYVKQVLKAPSTAKFPGSFLTPFEGWIMQNDNGVYKLQSYVDAQNSFGAMIRSEFYMEFKKNSSGNLELTKFNFDGQKIK